MSTSLSRATGRTARLNSETSLEPSDEWIAALRKSIENQLRPQLQEAERVRDEALKGQGSDEEARQKILEEYNNTKASYITIARLQFTEQLEDEKRRRRGTTQPDSNNLDSALPFAVGGSIDTAGGPDDDLYPSPRTSQEYTSRPSQAQSFPARRFGGDPENPSSGASLPRHIPNSRRESLDTFDAEPEDGSEPGSYGGYGSVSRRQSSGSMNSTKSKVFWRDAPQVSPRDAPVSRSSDYAPSPSTSAPRRGIASSINGSGISTAFAHSPPQPPPQVTHPPVRRDSNASLASSRSGGPGSLPRSSSTLPPFARNTITPVAAAVPIYTPPPQGPFGHSPSKKEITPDYYAPISVATSSRSPLPTALTSSEVKQPEHLDDEPLLNRPSPDVDNAGTGKSFTARSNMQRPVRHRTSSGDFHARRLAIESRPGSSASASRPSPIAVPSSPEYSRGPQPPPSSYSASQMRRFDDEQQNTTSTTASVTGIPIPSSSERAVTAPQASPEYSRSFGTHKAMMRRKTSFTADHHYYHHSQHHSNRNASQSPESSRVAYPVRRNSVSSHHSGKSAKSYNGYPDYYYPNNHAYANGSGNANGNGNEARSPMEPYAEQSHDGSASDHSDVDEEFDEQDFFEEMMLREEDMERREEELRQKVEEARRKEEEVSRKEEEAKRKEEEAKRKEEEIRLKEEESQRKEEEARRKEVEIKRKEELARRKEEEVKRKEEDARRKEEDARRKEEDARRMEEDARRTEDEARKMEEEVRKMEEEARRKEEEVRKKEEEMHRKAEEAERKEEDARRLEEEARRIEEEARLREEEAERKEEEVRKREEALRLKEEEFERMEQEARRLSDEAKRRAFELRIKEEEAVRREEEAKLMEEEAKRREEDARRREEDARRKEEDARRKEDDARRREEYARVRAEEAKSRADEVRQRAEDARIRAEEARVREDILRKREEEFKRKEDELRAREEELERREAETKRLEEEKRETEFLAEFARTERRRIDELVVEQQRIAHELASQREARRQAEQLAARLQAEEAEEAQLLAEQEELSRAEFLRQQEEARQTERLAKERREAELRLAEEQRNAEQLAEERRRAEAHAARTAEERSKAEERRRAELAEEERRRRQFDEDERLRKEIARQLEEQRKEETRRRTEHLRRQDTFGGNTTRSGTPSTSASQAAFSGTSRQAPASSANSDRSSTASNASWATNSSWTSWASQGSSASSASTQSTAKAAPPRRTTSSSSYTQPDASAPRRGAGAGEDDYVRWQERQEEHARRQAEAFRKEQERLERQRQAKAGQMLTKEAVVQIFDDHDRMWSRLAALDSATWSSFPWPMLKKPSTPEELTTTAISSYVLNPYNPSDKSEKDRIKEHIRRWHPDRFETKLLPKVRSEDRERVKEGAGQVVRSLNELLARSA